MNDKRRRHHQLSFSVRSLLLVVFAAGLLAGFLRYVLVSMSGEENREFLYCYLCWAGVLFLQVVFNIWALSGTVPNDAMSKRRKRRGEVFTYTFGFGALPILLFVVVGVFVRLSQPFTFMYLDPPSWITLLQALTMIIAVVVMLSLPFKVFAMYLYCGCKDQFPIVGSRVAILLNSCFGFLVFLPLL